MKSPTPVTFAGIPRCDQLGQTVARFSIQLDGALVRPAVLIWECYRLGSDTPLRFGLCSSTAADPKTVRIMVTGLMPGSVYEIRFLLDGQSSARARVCTRALEARRAA